LGALVVQVNECVLRLGVGLYQSGRCFVRSDEFSKTIQESVALAMAWCFGAGRDLLSK
jgi:hypothetical protein